MLRPRIPRFWTLYAALLLLRIHLALSPSYIHPDELFQAPELLAGDIFSLSTTRTWEFSPDYPIRSISPIYLFGAPGFYVLKNAVVGKVSGKAIFQAMRVQQVILSMVLDGLVYAVSGDRMNVLLFASHYATLSYHTHAFSNSWESILILLTYFVNASSYSLWIGVLSSIGLFTRPSFLFFMVPLAISRSLGILRRDPTTKKWVPHEPALQFLAFNLMAFSGTCAALVYVDTVYYAGLKMTLTTYADAVITVWNNVRYNSSLSSLANHGLHSRVTHFFNFLMFLGPGVVLIKDLTFSIYLAAMVTGVLGLSMIPHQEPRFLLPCLVLFFASLRVPKRRSLGVLFWSAWVGYNLLNALVYGRFHQCGVIPSSLYLNSLSPPSSAPFSTLHSPTPSSSISTITVEAVSELRTVTFTKCYPAPQFLVGPHFTISHVYGDALIDSNSEFVVTPLSDRVWNRTGYALVFKEDWHVDLDRLGELGLSAFKQRGMGVFQKQEEGGRLSELTID